MTAPGGSAERVRRRRFGWWPGRGSAAAALPLALLPALTVVVGCRRAADPVARLEVTPASLRLPYPEVGRLHLAWEPVAPLGEGPGRPTVFVHLLDAEGRVVRTFDHPFPDAWTPGRAVDEEVEIYQSVLGPPLAAATYRLAVGLYQAGGERWPLEVAGAAGEEHGRREYVVGTVEVPEAAASRPRFDFLGDWAVLITGADSQVLAYRWLQGEGSITVTDPPGPGRVRLALDLPSAEDPATLMVLTGGAQTATVMVTTSCGDAMACVSGAGRHWVDVPIGAGAAGTAGACEVKLAPNFYLITTGVPVRRAATLEVLGWIPDAEGAGGGGNESGARGGG